MYECKASYSKLPADYSIDWHVTTFFIGSEFEIAHQSFWLSDLYNFTDCIEGLVMQKISQWVPVLTPQIFIPDYD